MIKAVQDVVEREEIIYIILWASMASVCVYVCVCVREDVRVISPTRHHYWAGEREES